MPHLVPSAELGKSILKIVRYTPEEAFRHLPISFRESKLSPFSPFPRRILIIDPAPIAVHERVIEQHVRTIDFAQRWSGNPVAVTIMSERLKIATYEPGIYMINGLDYAEVALLDGHHRNEAAKRAGIRVIAQVFPMEEDDLTIGTWHEGAVPLTKDEVISVFLDRDLYVEPKATRFQVMGHRLAEMQPHVELPREYLQL